MANKITKINVGEYQNLPIVASEVDNTSFSINVNEKGNTEISNKNSAAGSKVNIVSTGAIQIKPGLTKKGKSAAIALDNEFNTASPEEVEIQATNGSKEDGKQTIGMKVNTTEVVLDTNGSYEGASGTEEIHIKCRRDKWNGGIPTTSTGPIYLKTHARAIDLRCHGHGGIALQIAGHDSDGKENKIKFESDRSSDINSTATYNGEGGKGLEFGTFNNEHASLFTKDYRFNEDGVVYAVSRETPVLEDGKFDYPTQEDDFKDILPGQDHPEKAATVESIVKTAWSLNEGPDRSCKMDGEVKEGLAGWVNSNLEIKTRTTYKWYQSPDGFTPEPSQILGTLDAQPDTEAIYKADEITCTPSELKLNKITTAEQGWSTANLYSWNGVYYALCTIASPGIKLESDGNIKLLPQKKLSVESPKVEYISTAGKVEMYLGDAVEFDKSTSGPGIVIDSPTVKFDGPVVQQFNSLNISAAGKLEDGGYIRAAGVFNLQHNSVYYDRIAGKVYVVIEPAYNNSGVALTSFTPDPTDKTKTAVFWDSSHTQPCRFLGKEGVAESGAKIYLPGTGEYANKLWACDTTKNGELKAPSKAYDTVTQAVGTGDADHIFCAEKTSEGVWTGLTGTEYENTIYVSSADKITTSNPLEEIAPSREWEAEVTEVAVSDIVKLVTWMKENHQGPWAVTQ